MCAASWALTASDGAISELEGLLFLAWHGPQENLGVCTAFCYGWADTHHCCLNSGWEACLDQFSAKDTSTLHPTFHNGASYMGLCSGGTTHSNTYNTTARGQALHNDYTYAQQWQRHIATNCRTEAPLGPSKPRLTLRSYHRQGISCSCSHNGNQRTTLSTQAFQRIWHPMSSHSPSPAI